MTDIERAEEYTNSKGFGSDYNNITSSEANEEIEKAVLYGLTEGRKEKWHDLRKNPNDLPEDCVINQDGKRVLYDHINKVWRNDDADEYICDDPIAWCEIPTFEE